MKPTFSKYILIALLLCSINEIEARDNISDNTLTVMFYNVQNYFDTIKNPLTNDEEFTPLGNLEWTQDRYIDKRDKLAKVIEAVNPNNPPEIIGLCEIENRQVLEDLINNTPLQHYGYQVVHQDSPDTRGIDVALLYRDKRVKIIDSAFYLMGDSLLNGDKREILYVKALINNSDSLHLFVNHFPSKRDGVKKTAPKRMAAAKELRNRINKILTYQPQAAIIAMGDFNDMPKSATIKEGLLAKDNFENIRDTSIYCLSAQLAANKDGSVYFQNRWQMVDLFFASGSLFKTQNSLYCKPENVRIFKPDFLLEYVAKTNNYRPIPTYRWVNYIGGYSDHLPVLLEIKVSSR